MGAKAAVTLLLAGLCSGCAGSDTHLRMLEKDNALQIEPAQSKDYDYVVKMKNLLDIGYDPDNPETRKDTALRSLKTQCPEGRIVGEQVIEKGNYAIGRPAREYFVQVKCGPDLPPPVAPPPAAKRSSARAVR